MFTVYRANERNNWTYVEVTERDDPHLAALLPVLKK